MSRRRRIAHWTLLIVCLVGAMAISALSVRSRYRIDLIWINHAFGSGVEYEGEVVQYQIQTPPGHLLVVRSHEHYPGRVSFKRFAYASGEAGEAMSDGGSLLGKLGFRFGSDRESSGFTAWGLQLPLWSIIVLLGVLAIVPAWRLRRADQRRLTDHCPACGYNLRATPDRCPECGRANAAKPGDTISAKA